VPDTVTQALIAEIGAQVPESRWRVVERTDTDIVSEADIEVKGKTVTIRRRQMIGDEELQAINKHLYDTSGRFSQRSAGEIGTPVANIPLSIVFDPRHGIAENMKKGNRDHLRWWLNREENQPFRSHKGKL